MTTGYKGVHLRFAFGQKQIIKYYLYHHHLKICIYATQFF